MVSEKNKEKVSRSEEALPLITQLMSLIFGDRRPDAYTLITFYINLFLWFCFFSWTVASYLTLHYKDLITEQKRIPVELIIGSHGEALGFQGDEFISRLETLHGVDFLTLLVVLFGLILLYRKNKRFIYFLAGGMIFHTGMQLFYISFTYFSEDVTLFDKTALLTMLASCFMYWFLLKREDSGGSISFFEEEEAVE